MSRHPSSLPRLVSPGIAADALGVSERTVRRLIDRGELAAARVGRQLRIDERELRLFLLDARVLPDTETDHYDRGYGDEESESDVSG